MAQPGLGLAYGMRAHPGPTIHDGCQWQPAAVQCGIAPAYSVGRVGDCAQHRPARIDTASTSVHLFFLGRFCVVAVTCAYRTQQHGLGRVCLPARALHVSTPATLQLRLDRRQTRRGSSC